MLKNSFYRIKLWKKKPDDLIDIEWINRDIILDIRYATTNNFVNQKVYNLPKCFLRKSVAFKLVAVQKKLEAMGLGLKVFDGYRPLSVQKKFWEILPDERYVANPVNGSRHNRGAAVDLTLVDKGGKELLMPTDFDEFTIKAHHDCNDLPKVAIHNRELLKKVMVEGGFVPYASEWWHYDDADWTKYPIEDILLENI